MSKTKEWVNCPVCGEPDMLKSGVDGEFLIFCVNHACASNGGTNHDALVSQLQNELNEAKIVQERTDQMLNSALFQLKKMQCKHERLNEDGICRSCGADRRGI